MKSLIQFFVIIGVASAGLLRRDSSWNTEIENQCFFYKEESLLRCRGLSGTVECDADLQIDKTFNATFNVFGISAQSNVVLNRQKIYELYPKKILSISDEYLENSVSANQNIEKIVLYTAPASTKNGLRILEPLCFKKLSTLLNSINQQYPIDIETNKASKVKASIIGEITIVDKATQKRW